MNTTVLLLPLIPMAWLLAASLVFFVALNVSQASRVLLFPVLLAPTIASFATLQCFTYPPGLDSVWGVGIVIWIAHITSLLYIDKIPAPRIYKKHWDTLASYKLNFNFRNLQPLPTRNVSRWQLRRFIALQISKLSLEYWLTIHLLIPSITLTIGTISTEDFDITHATYLRRLFSSANPITTRGTYLRIIFTLRWLAFAIIELEASHALCSLFFVTIGLDSPSEWPLLFDNPLQAYSIRRFWGVLWHRLAYKPYGTVAKSVSRNFFRCRRDGTVDKTFIAFLVFFLSGAAHSAVGWFVGSPHYLGDIMFFCANFAAMSLEIFVVARIEKAFPGVKRTFVGKVGSVVVGFVWTFGFLCWIVPKWHYPRVHSMLMERQREQEERLAVFFEKLLS